MCYQKFHDCRYCGKPYPCDIEDHICPTINHDVNMYMCPSCEEKLEEKLEDVDLEKMDLLNVDISEILEDE